MFLPETMMKVYLTALLVTGLLVTVAYAEKKVNLEDIERDNLRAENKVKNENIQTDETKYAVQPNQQQYQIPNQYSTLDSNSESYNHPQGFQDVKYSLPPEAYIQPNQYAVHEVQYKQPSQILPQQHILPIQYYRGYQQQQEIPAKGVTSIAYESQKFNYQPEIVVGNHIQNIQQKAITEKYAKANREPVYLDVPVTQLLSYYPQLNINSPASGKSAGLVQPSLHQLANNVQQISIPVYAPVYNQKQLVSSAKTSYSTVVPTTFRTKASKGSVYNLPITSKKINLSTLLTTPVYVQPQQSPAKEKTLLHTQAYITPSQPHYVQQLVYMQPGIVYTDPAAAYSDIYARFPAYIQDNSLSGQINQYQTQQQLYVIPTINAETPKKVLQEQISQDLPQNYVKVPEEPNAQFVPPQLPPQDFKSGITQLKPVSIEEEQSLPVQDQSLSVQDHSLSTEPRSLLDTYIPSKIIAAQDSARYRERPIKLEGGFLPSKVNFSFKKRKSE